MTDPDRPIYDPEFWRKRIAFAREQGRLWLSVFQGVSPGEWDVIEANHRRLLQKHVRSDDAVLDVGCGYGRVLDLLLETGWRGCYTGVDLVTDFIDLARSRHDDHVSFARFVQMDLRAPDARLVPPSGWGGRTHDYDVAVAFAVRNVVQGCGDDGYAVWDRIQADLLRRCAKLLVVNYDPTDEGELVTGPRST